LRAAVVGHVEWIEFGRVDHVPVPGEIVHVSEAWQEPAGGGAVAAMQLCKLAGAATLYTALGDDEIGHRAKQVLEALGLRV
jgi:ribokinase